MIRNNSATSYTTLVENLSPFTKNYFRAYVVANNNTFFSEPAVVTTKGLRTIFDKIYKKSDEGNVQIVEVEGSEISGFYVRSSVSNRYSIVHPRLTKINASG